MKNYKRSLLSSDIMTLQIFSFQQQSELQLASKFASPNQSNMHTIHLYKSNPLSLYSELLTVSQICSLQSALQAHSYVVCGCVLDVGEQAGTRQPQLAGAGRQGLTNHRLQPHRGALAQPRRRAPVRPAAPPAGAQETTSRRGTETERLLGGRAGEEQQGRGEEVERPACPPPDAPPAARLQSRGVFGALPKPPPSNPRHATQS
jgi:hypothetical protein